MGKSMSRVYRSARAVVIPKQPATRSALKAQEQLVEQVSDDEVTRQDETLHRNLRSVYIQSEKTNRSVKPSAAAVRPADTNGVTADELLLMFYERRNNEMKWTAEKIATDYNLSLTDAENLLRYFNNFVLVKKIPPRTSPLKDNPYSMN